MSKQPFIFLSWFRKDSKGLEGAFEGWNPRPNTAPLLDSYTTFLGQDGGMSLPQFKTPQTERRRYPPAPFHCPIGVTGDLVDGKGTVLTISLLGCIIACATTIQEGAYVNLWFHLPQDEMPMKVELAVVRWANDGKMGVEFIRMHPHEQERLHWLLKFLEMAPSQ